MINTALFKREAKASLKLLIIFAAILSMYITLIIGMFDPDMAQVLLQFETLMPELMSAFGMQGTADTLIGFMSSYLYGMLLLVLPMVYCIIRANGLIAKYVEQGSMACLVSSPVKRTTIATTQLSVLLGSTTLLIGYCTALEFIVANLSFPEALDSMELLRLNFGLLALHFFIGSFCFLCSCLFNETKYSLAFGAGIPTFMYVIKMLANMGSSLENAQYLTIFSLFRPEALIQNQTNGWISTAILLLGCVIFSGAGIWIFKKKDLCL